jgi:glutamate synthase domain-containing protein 2
MRTVDLAKSSRRDLNAALHEVQHNTNETYWRVENPAGQHALAVGLDAPVTVEIAGHVGYYCAGMNQQATVVIEGNAGVGVAENMMSGKVHVKGDASQSAGATAHGGLLVIEGNAAARCGISMKGIDIVVKGSIGPMSAFRNPPRAATGIYDIRGGAPSASCRISTICCFLGASMSRYPLEGYREKCATDVVLGTRFAKKPIHLKIPITIAGMSFGALSAHAKEALGRGATAAAPRPPPATAA